MSIHTIPTPDPKPADAATLDWTKMSFKYTQTRSYIIFESANGKWDEGRLVNNPYIPIHIAASALHYGQACFEGMKAFKQANGDVVVFRPLENARRLATSCKRLVMDCPSEDMFVAAIERVIKDNWDYIPPMETGGSLYLRPIVFGHAAQLGVAPAAGYTFIVMVVPVGPYYPGGLTYGVKAQVITDYDRAAPMGTGSVKMAGNYAASLLPHVMSGKAGYPIELYLDAKTNSKVEEFTTSNFFGIKVVMKDGKEHIQYWTPKSPSILPSITNKSIREICTAYLGWEVVECEIYANELGDFCEVGATGTAVVVTPVKEIQYGEKLYKYAEKVGKYTMKLYETVQDIQYGRIPDKLHWNHYVHK